METWAEKNSVLRDYVFTQVRGSSRGIPDRGDKENIVDFKKRIVEFFKNKMKDSTIDMSKIMEITEKRAWALTWLKLYNKRDALSDSGCKLEAKIIDNEIRNHQAVIAANKDASNKFHGQIDKSFYFVIEGCDKYFTQDDPFTHDVLSAIFDWLQMKQLENRIYLENEIYIRIDSFSYLFKDSCESDEEWKNDKNGLKDIACSGYKDATPFVLMIEAGGDVYLENVASDVITSLNEFLKRIKDAVDSHELSGLVYDVVSEELDKMRDEKNKKNIDNKQNDSPNGEGD